MLDYRFIVLLSVVAFSGEILATCNIEEGKVFCFRTTESEFLNFASSLSEDVHVLLLSSTEIRKLYKFMFDFVHLKTMARLNIVNCEISDIEEGLFEGYNQLVTIEIDDNRSLKRITSGTFRGAVNLEELILDEAGVASIEPGSFTSTPKLNKIIIINNDISYLETGSFYGAKPTGSLLLDNNNIYALYPETFYGLISVRDLFIRHNSITNLQDNTFMGLNSLKTLSLNDNPLTKLNYDAFKGLESLETLDLSNTGIHNYDINKLKEYMPNLKTVIVTYMK